VFAPKDTPAPIIARRAEAIETALADATVSQRLIEQGLVPVRVRTGEVPEDLH